MAAVTAGLGRTRTQVGRRAPDLAAVAGSGARWVVTAVVALRGLVGLLLVSYGAWLAYAPAGFIVAGLGVLADRVADEQRERRPDA